jgi:hypothetical protein
MQLLQLTMSFAETLISGAEETDGKYTLFLYVNNVLYGSRSEI